MLEVMCDMLQSRYLRSKSCAQTISANVLKILNQLRPISLTNITMRLSERVVFRSELFYPMSLIILLVLVNLHIAKATILPWPWLSVSTNDLNSLI